LAESTGDRRSAEAADAGRAKPASDRTAEAADRGCADTTADRAAQAAHPSSAEAADPGATKAAADGGATKASAEAATMKAAAAVKAGALGERLIRQAGQQRQCCNSSEQNPFHASPPSPRMFLILDTRRPVAREGSLAYRRLTRERFRRGFTRRERRGRSMERALGRADLRLHSRAPDAKSQSEALDAPASCVPLI
jgi:hypothetical protein